MHIPTAPDQSTVPMCFVDTSHINNSVNLAIFLSHHFSYQLLLLSYFAPCCVHKL